MSLKTWFTKTIRTALQSKPVRMAKPHSERCDTEQQVLAEDCVFPLIRGEGGAALRDLTHKRAHAILEEEVVAIALHRSRSSR